VLFRSGPLDKAYEQLKTGERNTGMAYFKDGVMTWDKEKLTYEDKLSIRSSLHNAYLWAKQEAGGYENPMFMFTNQVAFAKLDPRQFKTVRVAPRGKAMGYYMGDAEHEWRTAGGKTVRVTDVMDNGFDIDNIDTIIK
jgi:hypothetical protein